MSTDQTGTTGKLVKRNYITLNFKKDWCSYPGHCDYKTVLSNDIADCCLICKYRTLFDIPTMIKQKHLKAA